jgi:hypothetical protein
MAEAAESVHDAGVPVDHSISQCILYASVVSGIAYGLKQYVFPRILPSVVDDTVSEKDRESIGGRLPLWLAHIVAIVLATYAFVSGDDIWLRRSIYVTFAAHAADIIYFSAFNHTITGWMGASMWLHRILVCGVIAVAFVHQLELGMFGFAIFVLNLSSIGEIFITGIVPYLPAFFASFMPLLATIQFTSFFVFRAVFIILLILLYKPGDAQLILLVWGIIILFLAGNHLLLAQARWPLLSQGMTHSFKDVAPQVFRKTCELAVELPYLDYLLSTYILNTKASRRMREARRRVQKESGLKRKKGAK